MIDGIGFAAVEGNLSKHGQWASTLGGGSGSSKPEGISKELIEYEKQKMEMMNMMKGPMSNPKDSVSLSDEAKKLS